jgi:hypothetical protein
VNRLYKQTTNSSTLLPKLKTACYEILHGASDLDRFCSEGLNVNVSTTSKIGAKIFHIFRHMTDSVLLWKQNRVLVGRPLPVSDCQAMKFI